jgi:hypothetical protein
MLLIAFVLINSAVLFHNKTLLPIAPSNMIVPERPYGYKGPSLDWTTTVDPFGSLNVCYAFDAFTSHCAKQGVMPFWDPYQGLGQPFLAVGLSAVLYPVNWLHLVLPQAWWDIVFLLNWFLGALFLYCYLRLFDIEPPAALIGGLAMFACGAIEVYLPLREVPAVAAWWPLLLYAIERTYQQPAWRWRHAVLAIALFCTVTGGQPEAIVASLLAGAAYAAFRIISAGKQSLALLGRLVPGAAAGLLLSAPHWLNFAAYAFSSFSAHPGGGGTGFIHLPFQTIASFFFPYFYGRVQTDAFGYVSGFSWNFSNGWATPLSLFLALAWVTSLRGKPRLAPLFLGLVAIVTLAKIYGVPGINALGGLPFLDRITFPRYAAFLPGMALAGLAAFGISSLAQASNRAWLLAIIAWTAVVAVVFALGVASIWPSLSHATRGTEARQTFLVFGLGGLAWALIQPLCLWWIRYRRPAGSLALYAGAGLGILLHAVALAANGYSTWFYARLSIAGLASFIVLAAALGFVRRPRLTIGIAVAGAAVVALFPVLAAARSDHGLPARYNPLTAAPFISELQRLQEGGLYRSYSLDAVPAPDFAAPFDLSSLDNLDAICPEGTQQFVLDYLDFGLWGLMFTGNRSVGPAYGTAFDQIKKNKRYYDLVAVKYLVTDGPTLGSYVYDTRAAIPGNPHPVLISAPLTATFVAPVDQFSSVQVPIGTYGRQNPGMLELDITGQDGRLIESSQIPTAELHDNQYADFPFSNIKGVQGQTLHLSLNFRPGSKDSVVAAYAPPDNTTAAGFHFRVPTSQGDFRVIYRDQETRAVIWENPAATPRVFLAPDVRAAASGSEALSLLKDIPNLTRSVVVESDGQAHSDGKAQPDPDPAQRDPRAQSDPDPAQPAGTLREFHVSPNEVRIKYSANLPGVITVADSFSDGWRAEVNAREAPVLRVDGVFRGVKIETPGELDVRFWYRPPRWNLSLGLCGVGVLLLLVSLFTFSTRETYSRGFPGLSLRG